MSWLVIFDDLKSQLDSAKVEVIDTSRSLKISWKAMLSARKKLDGLSANDSQEIIAILQQEYYEAEQKHLHNSTKRREARQKLREAHKIMEQYAINHCVPENYRVTANARFIPSLRGVEISYGDQNADKGAIVMFFDALEGSYSLSCSDR